ncbi:hypothetical protein RN607_03535 [Demequina capsici]|uniref:Uncharacterized protein n=1 Tax=Demequina capsici TaxID=3075620 RepID=A0AA96FEU8_9MICO|nr:hypothetical protein [Demequina sp. PMTSA13]WNM28087.1 hypothetical protein RN607_03535 [Demequina sp. PMTSA13]
MSMNLTPVQAALRTIDQDDRDQIGRDAQAAVMTAASLSNAVRAARLAERRGKSARRVLLDPETPAPTRAKALEEINRAESERAAAEARITEALGTVRQARAAAVSDAAAAQVIADRNERAASEYSSAVARASARTRDASHLAAAVASATAYSPLTK